MLCRSLFACFKLFPCSIKARLFHRIADLKFTTGEKTTASIKGWVSSVRKMKNNIFFDVSDGSSPKPIQVVIPKNSCIHPVSFGCSVTVEGTLTENQNRQLEIQADDLKIIGPCDLEKGYPFAPRKTYSNEYLRQYPHFRLRTAGFSSLLRIRHSATCCIHEYFSKKGYANIHTPILTSNDCEGAGEVFTVETTTPTDNESTLFFNKIAYLTVSGQLHLEVAARGLNQVYCFGPTFRAENSKSRLHLSEFYMLEAETSYISDINSIVSEVESLLCYLTEHLLNNNGEDIYLCRKTLGSPELNVDGQELEKSIDSNFTVLSYEEASGILLNNSSSLKTEFKPGQPLVKDDELFLVRHNGNRPLFVVDWPAKIKPFYMKSYEDEPDKVMAFDLLCPNVGEICGGSIREDNNEKLKSVLESLGLQENLNWYLQLRDFGNITTGGYGLGFERYLQVLLGILNIKDSIPFPRWPHNCKL